MKVLIHFIFGTFLFSTTYGQDKSFIETKTSHVEGFLLKPQQSFSIEDLLSKDYQQPFFVESSFKHHQPLPTECTFMSGIMNPPYGDGKESTYDIHIESDKAAGIVFFISLDIEQLPLEDHLKGDYIGGVYRGEGFYEDGLFTYDRSYVAAEYRYREVIFFKIRIDPLLSSPTEILATQKMIFQNGKIEITVKKLTCQFKNLNSKIIEFLHLSPESGLHNQHRKKMQVI